MTQPKASSYGGVLINARGEVLLREPRGHYGGYVWTFAKGRPKKGERPEQTALREVRKKLGHRARIIAPLPQAFSGTTSTSAFYLMEPTSRQGKLDEKTTRTRWLSPEEASELIKQTKTSLGRRRDLSILHAAREVFDRLGPADRPTVRKEDWDSRPMPKLRKTISLDLVYDAGAMNRISKGFLPGAMEEKWFAWFKAPILHLHRSWTGYCIYQVYFSVDGCNGRAASAVVNRDPKQYTCTDDDEDRELIALLIENCLVRSLSSPRDERPAGALCRAALPNFLGAPPVVEGLVRKFGETVCALRAQYNADKIDGAKVPGIIRVEAEKMQRIFYGGAEGYTSQPWNSPEQLGERIAKRYGFSDGSENAVTGAFIAFANELLAIMIKAEDGEIAEKDWQWQVSAGVETVTFLLLGYPDSMIDAD